MLAVNLRETLKKFPVVWNTLRSIKDNLKILFRLKDVAMMMLLFQIWPEQTYRFSTRKLLPPKKNRFSKNAKPIIPYDLLKSKSSNIPLMDEVNVVGRGSSFNLNDIKNLNGPIFLCSFWSPVRIDKEGNLLYTHGREKIEKKEKYINNYRVHDVDRYFNDKTYEEYRNNNITYAHGRKIVIEKFIKNGNNILGVSVWARDKNQNYYPQKKANDELTSALNLFSNHKSKLVTMLEKVYQPSINTNYSDWAPTKSLLPFIIAVSFFAKKVNVYGWDNYLDTSPKDMSYWQLFFKMYSYKLDIHFRNLQDYFETSLLNFYYGYHLSKLPQIRNHGHMGHLNKHSKLITKIERVLFK